LARPSSMTAPPRQDRPMPKSTRRPRDGKPSECRRAGRTRATTSKRGGRVERGQPGRTPLCFARTELRRLREDAPPSLSDATEARTRPQRVPPDATDVTEHVPPDATDVTEHVPPDATDVTEHVPPDATAALLDATERVPPDATDVTEHVPPDAIAARPSSFRIPHSRAPSAIRVGPPSPGAAGQRRWRRPAWGRSLRALVPRFAS